MSDAPGPQANASGSTVRASLSACANRRAIVESARPVVAIGLLCLAVALASCATWQHGPIQPGQSEAEVITRLGTPTARYRDGSDRLLEYRRGPMGQTTHMARIDASGRLASYEQVLTLEQFGKIKAGTSRKEDVLKLVGAPSERRSYFRSNDEVWHYPYKENGVWDSQMSISFDESGIVSRVESGPDPRFLLPD